MVPYTHVGYVRSVYITVDPSLSTFFSISVATHDYCTWLACDSSNESYDNRDDSSPLAIEIKTFCE